MFTKNRIQISRRNLVKLSGCLGLASLAAGFAWEKWIRIDKNTFSGELLGSNHQAGHLLRAGLKDVPTEIRKIKTAIVGAGIAGLSTAWYLQKHSYKDFLIFELDSKVGGTSQSGENNVSAFPWGAHYVPFPSEEAKYVRELFEEIGIITGYENGLPIYNEYYLCADPHERLFYQGLWKEGIVPQYGVKSEDKRQYQEFFDFIEKLKIKKGSDGRPAFAIPIMLSSKDEEFLSWDHISMKDFMLGRNWNSIPLIWYVNYCCRDDYGAPFDKVSAWAGIHYFAARSGKAANSDSQTVLTWPQGNGFLVQYLSKLVEKQIVTQSLVYRISSENNICFVDVFHFKENKKIRYQVENVVFCGPQFAADKIIENYQRPPEFKAEYAPWLIGNITLSEMPDSRGAELSWDNVNYYSRSLGYIVANHQDVKQKRKEKVITYYYPLDDLEPKEARSMAYQKSYGDWLDLILPDLEKTHRGIIEKIKNIDIWVWGHGMAIPRTDFIWKTNRLMQSHRYENIYFAHSDLSGIAIFEEAQYWGVRAAKQILNQVVS
jgi:hypothetical protein